MADANRALVPVAAFFGMATVGSIVLAMELSQWIFLAAFLATWVGAAWKIGGSTIAKFGGGFLVAFAGTLVAVFVTNVFIGAASV